MDKIERARMRARCAEIETWLCSLVPYSAEAIALEEELERLQEKLRKAGND